MAEEKLSMLHNLKLEVFSWILYILSTALLSWYLLTEVTGSNQFIIVGLSISFVIGLFLVIFRFKFVAYLMTFLFNAVIFINMFTIVNDNDLGNVLNINGSCLDICIGNGLMFYLIMFISLLLLILSLVMFVIRNKKNS